MSDTVKKPLGRPRGNYVVPDDSKDDVVFMTMYRTWCAQKKAKASYYQRNREQILQKIKEKKQSNTTVSDLVATKT